MTPMLPSQISHSMNMPGSWIPLLHSIPDFLAEVPRTETKLPHGSLASIGYYGALFFTLQGLLWRRMGG